MSPNIGLRIPPETLERLQVLAGANGCTVSDVVRLAIDKYLESPKPLAGDSTEGRLTALEEALAALTVTVSSLLAPVSRSPQNKVEAIHKTQSDRALAPVSGVLTTSEAFAELKRRGWQGQNPTLRRKLKDGIVPPDLQRLGLAIDSAGWQQRLESPKDNRVQWLYFEDKN